MRIIGLSAYYHDSAAALVVNGRLVAAAQEERFTRIRHDAAFPYRAIESCLSIAGLTPSEIDGVVFYDKPFLKFERLLETYLAFAPRGFKSFAQAMPLWIKDKLFQKRMILEALKSVDASVNWAPKLQFSEHHLSHAASAFFASPFERAAVLTMDGVGEWTTTSLAIGNGTSLEVHREIQFPHSLGLLYSALTYYTGFKVNSGEYKVMGLAPYGEPKYANLIKDHLIDIKSDGSFRLDMQYFDYCTGLTMTNAKFDALFGAPPRKAEARLTQRDMDLAASIQAVTEEVVRKLAGSLARETGERNLCLAGGVALNCVANGLVLRDKSFDRIWIQPAAGDAGGAVGAALFAAHALHDAPRNYEGMDAMQGSYLGPAYSQSECEARLTAQGARFKVLPNAQAMTAWCADQLAAGKALGWHQGRMEFGPRSLGARSILGDARSATMQKVLNLKVKFRESFRPFAPSVLAERANEWFDIDCESPYMLLVAPVQESKRIAMSDEERALFGIEKLNVPRSQIPSVTHVDYSARVQSVHRETNPLYHQLLTDFQARTGCPVLVNTSFNVRGEPIVNTPEDAFGCFMGTDLDALAVGLCVLEKSEQDPALKKNYEHNFELD